jgi:hypothetical protein
LILPFVIVAVALIEWVSWGSVEYGATGAAAGYACETLTGMGNLLKRGKNNPINTADIQSGHEAISKGGKLGIAEYVPPEHAFQLYNDQAD